MRLCTLPGCGRPHQARGLCNLHYRRWRREGADFDRRPGLLQPGPRTVESAPLIDAIKAELRRRDRGWRGWARDNGIHERNLYRWRESGLVSVDLVDHVCEALCVHPVELYGDAYFAERSEAA